MIPRNHWAMDQYTTAKYADHTDFQDEKFPSVLVMLKGILPPVMWKMIKDSQYDKWERCITINCDCFGPKKCHGWSVPWWSCGGRGRQTCPECLWFKYWHEAVNERMWFLEDICHYGVLIWSSNTRLHTLKYLTECHFWRNNAGMNETPQNKNCTALGQSTETVQSSSGSRLLADIVPSPAHNMCVQNAYVAQCKPA